MNAILNLIIRILLIVSLYSFLAVALWLIWKSVSTKSTIASKELIPALTLSYPASGPADEQRFVASEVTIGREPDCDFVIPSEVVSARHGKFSFHQNHWWYEDLKSTNGTFLENLRIEEPVVVKDGDVLFFGEVGLKVQFDTAK